MIGSQGAAQIVVPGPHIEVRGEGRHQQRAEVARDNARMADMLVQSGAWEWFVAQCEAKAAAYERQLSSAAQELSPRAEDRHRGRIEAYRAMPDVVTKVAVAHAKAQQKAQQEQQEQST